MTSFKCGFDLDLPVLCCCKPNEAPKGKKTTHIPLDSKCKADTGKQKVLFGSDQLQGGNKAVDREEKPYLSRDCCTARLPETHQERPYAQPGPAEAIVLLQGSLCKLNPAWQTPHLPGMPKSVATRLSNSPSQLLIKNKQESRSVTVLTGKPPSLPSAGHPPLSPGRFGRVKSHAVPSLRHVTHPSNRFETGHCLNRAFNLKASYSRNPSRWFIKVLYW